jgi:GGDEF domain-containing protein
VLRARGALAGDLAAAIAGLPAGRALLLFVLDVDGLRLFNAEHGYAAGDAVLDDLARRLAGTTDARAYALGAGAFALVL